MKKFLLFFSLSALVYGQAFSQTLYSNTTESGYFFNPGLSQLNNPKVMFDDVLIPNATLAGKDTIRVTKIKVGISRLANAPATTVSLYYTLRDDTATYYNSLIKIPPVFLGNVSLPANGSTGTTAIVSLGDSVATLFKLKVAINNIYNGYQALFIGAGLSNSSNMNGISLTVDAPNDNAIWIYNADSTIKRFATSFGVTPATCFIQVFGTATSGPLPITLSSFIGNRNGKINLLSWTTATEQNNTGFELQRSADGINYSKLGFIASKATNGNSSAALTYSFDDVKPLTSNGYYRLKQIDKDGKSTTSSTILIKGLSVSTLTVSTIYPNPVKNSLNVIVTGATQNTVTLTIADFSGKVLSSQTKQMVSGDNQYQINTSALASGNYLLKVTDSKGETTTQRFSKQ